MSENSSDDFPSYGMEAIISTIDDEKELLDVLRIESKNQGKYLHYLNERRRIKDNTNKKKNKNIIGLSAVSNVPMD
jgi:hypothetical protein